LMKAFTLTTFDRFGNWSADLPLRLFLAWEFFESGLEKLNGSTAHWSSLAELAQGYAITDQGFGNYKLPLIYLVALLPLLLKGAGRFSLDHWLRARFCR